MANSETQRPREQAKYWSDPQIKGLDLLRATFVTHAFPRHTHDQQFVLGAIEQGTQLCFNSGAKHYSTAGTVILLNPDTAHTGVTVDDAGYRYRALYPTTELMQSAGEQIGLRSRGSADNLPFFRSPCQFHDPEMARAIIGLHEAMESPLTLLERDSRLLTLLARLFERYGEQQAPEWTGPETQAVRRTREYLQAHACENVSLQFLAASVGMSPFHLLRVFRERVGVPPHAYQTQQRVQRAHQLLLEGTPVAQAAIETGFVDQSHLTRHFKRLTGVSPGAFQRDSCLFARVEPANRNFVQSYRASAA